MPSPHETSPHTGPPGTGSDVIVGRIRGPWGLRGELKVEVLTDFPERFSSGSVLYLESQPVQVEWSRPTKDGFLVKLDTASDRSTAEALRGKLLCIPPSEVKPLPEGSYYHFQILDMGVWSEQGDYMGKVQEILVTGSHDVYVIANSSGREMLIPAVRDFVLRVDLQENRMTVRLPEVFEPSPQSLDQASF